MNLFSNGSKLDTRESVVVHGAPAPTLTAMVGVTDPPPWGQMCLDVSKEQGFLDPTHPETFGGVASVHETTFAYLPLIFSRCRGFGNSFLGDQTDDNANIVFQDVYPRLKPSHQIGKGAANPPHENHVLGAAFRLAVLFAWRGYSLFKDFITQKWH